MLKLLSGIEHTNGQHPIHITIVILLLSSVLINVNLGKEIDYWPSGFKPCQGQADVSVSKKL
jgi:hypothetical protein